MFYRIKDNKVYDFADYKYDENCLETDLCSMSEYQNNTDIYDIKDNRIELVSDYQNIIASKRQQQFEKEFFRTSLGWIRRQVNMKDGSKKDFLSDLLMAIKAGVELGQEVLILTYREPDFNQELTPEYIISLQEKKPASEDFIRECLQQTVIDFGM